MKLAACTPRPHGISAWSPLFDMDRLFGQFFERPSSGGESSSLNSWNPPLDVSETETEVVIRSEVPGVSPEELEITVDGDVLTLAGEKKSQTEDKDTDRYYVERRFGSFRRQLQLPSSVNSEKVSADYKDGVLTVTLAKKETAVPKKIAVNGKT